MNIPRREFIAKGSLVAAAAAGTQAIAQESPRVPPAPSGNQPYVTGSEVKKLDIVNLLELEDLAEKIVPVGPFTYIKSGSGGEWTKQENRNAYDRVQIEPQPLSGIDKVDLTTTILGSRMSMPIFIPPMGGHGLAHASGEIGTAKAAEAENILMVTSHMSNATLESIAGANGGHKWFQIYFPVDQGYARELAHRARDAKYTAIVATVDDQVAYPREQNARAAYRSPSLGPGNASITIKDPAAARAARAKKLSVSFDDLVWLKKESGLPVIVKGLVSPKVAAAAISHGLDAVYVSNHGGRSLDTVPATLTALPRVADAVKGRVPVIFDGGIRRGTDVFKALAQGADLVGCGRPMLYGLALGGTLGVQSVLNYLRQTLTITMQLAGTPNVKAITREYLTRS